jgi:hypothetical protein
VITNQPGGGGGVALADVAGNRNDDSDLVIAASPATAIRFAQNQYTGLEADEFNARDRPNTGSSDSDGSADRAGFQ